MTEKIIHRICAWNAERYEQIDNPQLTHDLLAEEVAEYKDAIYYVGDEVDLLDALVDTIYIAVGGMWKMGLTPEQIERAIHVVCTSNDSKTAAKTPSHIKANIDKGEGFIAPEPQLQEILNER